MTGKVRKIMRAPLGLLRVLVVGWLCVLSFAVDQNVTTANKWSAVATPFRPVNITAVGTTIWVCGADEMILRAKDGGAIWEVKHQNRDGEVLFDISFVSDKVGHAAGTGGLVLSTDDGGETWKSHSAAGVVRAISFADAMNGIAVVDEGQSPAVGKSSDRAGALNGNVKITHDGGEHWADAGAMDSPDLRPFVHTLAVAALDSSGFLMLRGQPDVEDAFVVTKDGGKSWRVIHPQNNATNRELPSILLARQGEYWAFGYELVHRQKGGGYGVPLALHSKDGETWAHGAAGPTELTACNSQGCYLWDGAVETLYGAHEQFWSLPQDGSLTGKWAIAGSVGCTVGSTLQCGPANVTEKPPDRPDAPGGIITTNIRNGHFADGCLECHVDAIVPDKAGPPSMQQVRASIAVRRDGTVASALVDFPPSKRMNDEISRQLSTWLFEPAHEGGRTAEIKKDLTLVLMCAGFPGRPETNRCTLHASDEFGGHLPAGMTTTTVPQ